MDVRSLGFRTDLALLAQTGSEIDDRGTHLVVRTPANPAYFWGNFLLLAHAPHPGGEREVVGAFQTEFPLADHVSIGLDEPELTPQARAAFEQAGLEVEVAVVLTASTVTTPRAPAVDAEVRALESDDDWEARARLGATLHPRTDETTFRSFARGRSDQERALVASGSGQRYGAFVDGRLVSTAGIFRTEPGVARFQSVETDPAHRRQGLAGAVVHAAARHGLDELGARTLVIVADEGGGAIRIYRSLGFTDSERQLMMERRSGAWAPMGES